MPPVQRAFYNCRVGTAHPRWPLGILVGGAHPTVDATASDGAEGLVDHRRQGKAYVYLPTVDRGKTLRDLAGGFLERVFDGSLDEYHVHALGTRKVSKRELDQLEEMLATARSKKK